MATPRYQLHVHLAMCLLAACTAAEPDEDGALSHAQDPTGGGAEDAATQDGEVPRRGDRGLTGNPDAAVSGDAGEPITLSHLLSEMVDLGRFAELPDPPFLSYLASSHNPLSDTAEIGTSDWFANQDWIDIAAGETEVLLETEGPGVLTRIWSASPAGTLRVYIDGDDEPAVTGAFRDLLRGQVEPFVTPFAFVAAHGHNLYYPIPFARGCRVTLTGPTGITYFHIAYRKYVEGTELQSFSADAVTQSEEAQASVAERLSDLTPTSELLRSGALGTGGSEDVQLFELSTAAGSEALIESGDGNERGSVIVQLRATPSRTSPEALRSTILSIAFDGIETVRAPLGDFFASIEGGEINSIPIGVSSEPEVAMIARWVMPFAESARIRIEASDGIEQELSLEVTSAVRPWSERSLHFNAQWRPPETFPSSPPSDWSLAMIEGTGFYVGNVLNVVNPSLWWWGEGDEKIFVDDEAFPSHFGTGTEDYYGYAWCSNTRFSTGYIGQPVVTEHESFGRISLYRFHVLDPIPFDESLRFDMEVRHWGDPVDVTYDALSFWYALPGSRMVGAPAENPLFRVPELTTPVPEDAASGSYQCGG